MERCIFLLKPLQGDLILLAAGETGIVHKTMDQLRRFLAGSLGLIDVRSERPSDLLLDNEG